MRAAILLPLFSMTLGVLANPPACLLGVVGQQDSPHDLSVICGDDAENVQASLDKECSNDTKSVAQEAFISSCSAAGTSVAAYTPTSTSSGTATGSGSSNDPSNTASSFASGSSTASGSGAASTGDSGAGSLAIAGSFVMGAAAVAGLAIAL